MADVVVSSNSERSIAALAVYELHRSVGWWSERTEGDYAEVLRGGPAVGAWDAGDLVGFARAITDGRLHAYVDDVMVRPDWRRRGVAARVVDALCQELSEIRVVSLFASGELVKLSERCSFEPTRQIVLHRRRPPTR